MVSQKALKKKMDFGKSGGDLEGVWPREKLGENTSIIERGSKTTIFIWTFREGIY